MTPPRAPFRYPLIQRDCRGSHQVRQRRRKGLGIIEDAVDAAAVDTSLRAHSEPPHRLQSTGEWSVEPQQGVGAPAKREIALRDVTSPELRAITPLRSSFCCPTSPQNAQSNLQERTSSRNIHLTIFFVSYSGLVCLLLSGAHARSGVCRCTCSLRCTLSLLCILKSIYGF